MTDAIIQVQQPPLPVDVFRQRTLALEEAMRRTPGVQLGNCMPLKHSFAHGIYCREIFMPKGTLVVGKIHRYSHPNFLLQGIVVVASERDGVVRLQAPQMWISPALTKRTVFVEEDARWVTVHATTETDLEKVEESLVAPTFEIAEREMEANDKR